MTPNVNVIKLGNLYAEEAAVINVPLDYKADYGNEIVFILKWLSADHPDIKKIVENYYEAPKKNFDLLKVTVDDYNEWCDKYKSLQQQPQTNDKQAPVTASPHLVKYIMQLIYNRAVLDPGKLNHYEAFSPEVYGETSYSLIEKMLQRVPLQEDDVFLDLGSGVGNVVLQVAASNKCKLCVGVEKAEWPAKYAQNMEKEFKFWMSFFGKSYSQFKLFKGDFFSEDEFIETEDAQEGTTKKLSVNSYVKEIINEAKLVFVNNYAFGAEVDHQLKLRFLDMSEGARIVSSKPFCPLNFRINDRNLNDIGTILNVSEFEPLSGSVSWTPNPVSYYFHRIDRTLLEKYFFECKKGSRSSRDDNKTSSSGSSSSSSSSSSSPPQSSSPDINSSTSSLDEVTNSSNKAKSGKSRKRDRSYSPSAIKRSKEEKAAKEKKARVTSGGSDTKRVKKVKKAGTGAGASKGRGASLDSEEKKTLDAMHQYVAKVSNKSPATNLVHTTSITSKTASLSLQGVVVASSSKFNKKSLTPLGDNENLESKLFKDVSSKLYKQIDKSTTGHHDEKKTNGNLLFGSKNDIDGLMGRKELGDDIMNSIDNHFRELRRGLVKYLITLKSSQSLKDRLEQDKLIKAEYMKKIESFEAMNKTLRKSCADLVTKRAHEITGIKDLSGSSQQHSPKDILRYATTVVNEAKKFQSEINQLTTNQNKELNEQQQQRPHLKALSKIVSTIGSSSKERIKSNISVDSFKSDDTQSAASCSSNSSSGSSLKGFKIPKKSASVHSSESSSSVIHGGGDSYATRHEPIGSSSNSLESSSSGTCLNKSSSYYHPKKNQFRQYLIESSASHENNSINATTTTNVVVVPTTTTANS